MFQREDKLWSQSEVGSTGDILHRDYWDPVGLRNKTRQQDQFPEDSLGQHQASGALNLRVMLNRRAEAAVPWSGRNQEQREVRCTAHQMMQVVYRQPIV